MPKKTLKKLQEASGIAIEKPITETNDKAFDIKTPKNPTEKTKITETKKEKTIINIIEEKKIQYQADYNTQQKVIKELLPEISKEINNKYPNMYNDQAFLYDLTKTILEQKSTLNFKNTQFYIDVSSGLEIYDNEQKYKQNKQEKEKNKRNQETKEKENLRIIKATKFADSIFNGSSIVVFNNKYYINNKINTLFPQGISIIPFPSQEKANEFIVLSKEYIIAGGFKENNPYFREKKDRYLKEVSKMLFGSSLNNFTKEISEIIDGLLCFKNEKTTILPVKKSNIKNITTNAIRKNNEKKTNSQISKKEKIV